MGSLYKRKKDGPWYGRIQAGGVDFRKSLGTTSRAVAERLLIEWEEAENKIGNRSALWEHVCLRYIDEVMPHKISRSTQRRYLVSFKAVHHILVGKDVARIGRPEVIAIAKRKGVSVATCKRDLTAVTQVFRAAEAWGLIESNPFRTTDLSALIQERRDPIVLPTERDIDRFLKACPPTLNRLARFLIHTGARLEEGASLKWNQIDFDRNQATIKGKGNKTRIVPLDQDAMKVIQECPQHISSSYVFWHTAAGSRYKQASTQLWRIKERLGIEFRTHDLRHYFAVKYLERGGNIYRLQKILGHSNLKTTEDVYLRFLSPEEADRVRLEASG